MSVGPLDGTAASTALQQSSGIANRVPGAGGHHHHHLTGGSSTSTPSSTTASLLTALASGSAASSYSSVMGASTRSGTGIDTLA